MGPDVDVRPATPGDVDDIQRVAELAWHAVYDDILGPETVDEVLGEWYDGDGVESGIADEEHGFFVAVREESVLGFADVGPHPPRDVYRLYRLYVYPDEWRSGIGRQLLAGVERVVSEQDVHRYEAVALADNDVATSFYESTGFEQVVERTTELDGVSAAEYIYRKQI